MVWGRSSINQLIQLILCKRKWICEDQDGFIFDEKGHCHAGEEPSAPLELTVTIASAQLLAPVHQAITRNLVFENFELDLDFFNLFTGCTKLGVKFGTFAMTRGDADGPHVHVSFSFDHSEAGVDSKHTLSMEGVPEDDAVDWGRPHGGACGR